MAAQKLIAIKEFCMHHRITPDFIKELYRNEIIELVMIRRTAYIAEKQLQSLEKMIRLYTELNINIEGIQTILHLLSSLEKKDQEINSLRNLLGFYSSDNLP